MFGFIFTIRNIHRAILSILIGFQHPGLRLGGSRAVVVVRGASAAQLPRDVTSY